MQIFISHELVGNKEFCFAVWCSRIMSQIDPTNRNGEE
jgi:hypothetical protein